MKLTYNYRIFILINAFLSIKLCQGARWVDAKSWLDNSGLNLRVENHGLHTKRSGKRVSPVKLNIGMGRYHNLLRRSENSALLYGLSREETLKTVDSEATLEGTEVFKAEERFKGIYVYDAVVTVEVDKNDGHFTGQVSGQVLNEIENDIDNVEPTLKEANVLNSMINQFNARSYKSLNSRLVIYKHSNEEYARLVWKMSFFFEDKGIPRRPTCFIDAHNGEIVKCYNSLEEFKVKGTGGNRKTGKFLYGVDMPLLSVKRKNGKCQYKSKDVKVFDFRNKTESEEADIIEFDCSEGVSDEVNGAYSPSTDAYFFSKMTVKMFKQWAKVGACKLLPLEIDVHVSGEYNAYFDGTAFKFSDGDPEATYPYVTAGIVAHEISHCFTEYNAAFEYTGQSGSIDESFSDLVGEAVKLFIFGYNDWKAGNDVLKADDYVRYMCDQSVDGMSITHMDQYSEDKDVHFLSGIFNKVACEITESKGWNLKSVFQVFTHANRFYWHPTSGFTDAACGVTKAAYDLGHNVSDVKTAFADVGIETCNIEEYIRQIVANASIPNLKANMGEYIIFKVQSYKLSEQNDIKISTSNGFGDVELFLSTEPIFTKASIISSSAKPGNYETLIVKNTDLFDPKYLLLKPRLFRFSGVILTVKDC